MIQARNIISGYGSAPILRGIDLKLAYGEMVGVIGPNGSGKTTLVRTLSGLLPYSGSVKIAGESLKELSPRQRARSMAVVPQRFDQALHISVESCVLMGRYSHQDFFSAYTQEDYAIAEKAMVETDTLQFTGKMVSELSGGELQRVLLARALTQQSELLILDEPNTGLDFSRSIEIFDLLRSRMCSGTTILAVVHDLNLAALYCDRLIMIKNGTKQNDGMTKEIFTKRNLTKLYETEITVAPHPINGLPQAFYTLSHY